MEPVGGKNWAAEYLLDPLTAPQPHQETGPGSSFLPEPTSPIKRTPSTPSSRRLTKNNPYRQSTGSVPSSPEMHRSSSVKSGSTYSTPSHPASPKTPPYRQEAFSPNGVTGRPRGSSLNERFPGDMSHRPLDVLTKQKATADRSRHVTKKHQILPDTIDSLDNAAGSAYHHGGPYDATLFARNNSYHSPLQALEDSNREALRATPREKIIDSVKGHRPLDGVAAYAPGETDRNGHVYQYQKGDNMMTDNGPEGGAYKRWPGIQYHPDDIKGKGEPSYSIEKALKDAKLEDAKVEDKKQSNESRNSSIEMKARPARPARPEPTRSQSDNEIRSRQARSGPGTIPLEGWWDGEESRYKSSSISKRLSGGGLKKRIESVKRHLQDD